MRSSCGRRCRTLVDVNVGWIAARRISGSPHRPFAHVPVNTHHPVLCEVSISRWGGAVNPYEATVADHRRRWRLSHRYDRKIKSIKFLLLLSPYMRAGLPAGRSARAETILDHYPIFRRLPRMALGMVHIDSPPTLVGRVLRSQVHSRKATVRLAVETDLLIRSARFRSHSRRSNT